MNARIHVLSCSHVLTRAFTSIEAALFFQRKHGRRMALLDIGQLDTAALFHYVSGRALRFPRKNNPTVCEESTCNRKPKHKHFCNAAPVGSCSAWRTSDESVETFFFLFPLRCRPRFSVHWSDLAGPENRSCLDASRSQTCCTSVHSIGLVCLLRCLGIFSKGELHQSVALLEGSVCMRVASARKGRTWQLLSARGGTNRAAWTLVQNSCIRCCFCD